MKEFFVDGKIIRIEMENGKRYAVSKEYIEKSMTNLDIDMEEAVLTWLEDEGYLFNEDQEELCIAAKENGSLADARKGNRDAAKEKKKTVKTVKVNPDKEMLIAEIAKCIGAVDGVSDLNIENKGKLITFKLNNEDFKIDLVQKRKKKD